LRKVIFSLALAVSCFLSGCGYHLTSEMQIPSLIAGKTIAIPMWRNKSYRMNLETVMTGCLVDEFALRTGGMVVSEEGAADLLLDGMVVGYSNGGVAFNSFDIVLEYKMTMTVEAVLSEKKSQKVLWKGTLSASQDYPAVVDLSVPNRIAQQQNSEDAALLEISRKIARQLYQNMSEKF